MNPEQVQKSERPVFFAAQPRCPRCFYSLQTDPKNYIKGYWEDESGCPACNYSFVD